jgi:hypothetical protein
MMNSTPEISQPSSARKLRRVLASIATLGLLMFQLTTPVYAIGPGPDRGPDRGPGR